MLRLQAAVGKPAQLAVDKGDQGLQRPLVALPPGLERGRDVVGAFCTHTLDPPDFTTILRSFTAVFTTFRPSFLNKGGEQSENALAWPQHRLYYRPEPQGQEALRGGRSGTELASFVLFCCLFAGAGFPAGIGAGVPGGGSFGDAASFGRGSAVDAKLVFDYAASRFNHIS